MPQPDQDRLLQQMARDLRFLSYRHGRPLPPVVFIVVLFIGFFLFFASITFIAEIMTYLNGSQHDGHPRADHPRSERVIPAHDRRTI